MTRTTTDYLTLLVNSLSDDSNVRSVGKSGGEQLPAADESDIDLFIFCEKIPALETRRELANILGDAASGIKISTSKGRFWGMCDFITMGAADICLMYFTKEEIDNEIETVLNGERIGKEDGYFYPSGRCATILSLYAFFDKDNYISEKKEKLSFFPLELSKKSACYHIKRILNSEDFGRAVQKSDVLFYHSVLEIALDHFLQTLFALNTTFFPSRMNHNQSIVSNN